MSLARWALCALLLVLLAVPLSVPGLQATSYGGWPAIGFAVALFLAAGPERVRLVAAVQTVVVTCALTFSYDVPVWVALGGSLAVLTPALLSQHFLTKVRTGHLRLDEVDSGLYHLITAVSALLCGLIAMAATAAIDTHDMLLVGLMSFLAALTAQLTVLPLMVRRSGRTGQGGQAERMIQRVLTIFLVGLIFLPQTDLAVAFVFFPALGWAAIRASRREAHLQLFLFCVAIYVLTLNGHGPLVSPIAGVPETLAPAVLYLFIAAMACMMVPLTLTVEALSAMTGQATRAATTVERLLDAVSGALIIATDAQGRITHFNVGAQQTLGYPPEEVLGRSPAMLHTRQELRRQAAHFNVRLDHLTIVLAMVKRGERRDWEYQQKDGKTRMASMTISEVTDTDGQVIGYIGAGEDITERLRAEEAQQTALAREHASVLRLEEVDHVKQELVSNVSHELRTPITSIAGYAELLTDGSLGELNDGQSDAVRRIGRNTGRLVLLVEDLLTLSKAEAGLLELAHDEVDLRAVASEAFEMLEELLRGRALEAHLSMAAEPVVVVGDAHALERVVMNLMGNAIKFTPDGGQVNVTVSRTPHGASVTVSDTGLGISKQDQQHLFTRFFRASSVTERAIQGTGLGLSIVHSIVTQHGGSVSVESASGTGTTVTVMLPLMAPSLPLIEPLVLGSRETSDVIRSGAHGPQNV